ncbi:hypothetical protein JXO52_13225 [bacterium]|nr:hypothetical protein [bacterium]
MLFRRKKKSRQSSQADFENKRIALAKHAAELRAYHEKLIKYRDSLENAKQDIFAKRQTLQEAQKQLNGQKELFRIEKAGIINKKADLEQKNEEIRKKQEKLNQQQDLLNRRIREYQSNVKAFKEQQIKLNEQWTKLHVQEEEQKTYLVQLQNAIDEKSKGIEKREDELAALRIQLSSLQEQLNKQAEALTAREKQLIQVASSQSIEQKVIQVGLDFGTSSIKAVFWDMETNLHTAVDFNHGLEGYPNYCMPCVAALDDQGQLVIAEKAVELLEHGGWENGLRRFKVLVAANCDSSFLDQNSIDEYNAYFARFGKKDKAIPEDITVLILAYAMRRCREVISRREENKDKNLRLNFNICMPLEQYDDEMIQVTFTELFKEAVLLERYWFHCIENQFELIKILSEIRNNKAALDEAAQFMNAIPECVAGMVAFMQSLNLHDGKYALMDFGDGTIDVSICNVCKTGYVKQWWYSAHIIPFGMFHVTKFIAEEIEDQLDKSPNTLEDLFNIYNSADGAFRKSISDRTKDFLLQIYDSEDYLKHCWGQAYQYCSKESEWTNKVTVFKTGGGSLYKEIDSIFSKPWNKNPAFSGVMYPVQSLPKPGDFDEGTANAPFNRMSIAYGLSYPGPMIGGYTLPSKTPDQTPPPLPDKFDEIDYQF